MAGAATVAAKKKATPPPAATGERARARPMIPSTSGTGARGSGPEPGERRQGAGRHDQSQADRGRADR